VQRIPIFPQLDSPPPPARVGGFPLLWLLIDLLMVLNVKGFVPQCDVGAPPKNWLRLAVPLVGTGRFARGSTRSLLEPDAPAASLSWGLGNSKTETAGSTFRFFPFGEFFPRGRNTSGEDVSFQSLGGGPGGPLFCFPSGIFCAPPLQHSTYLKMSRFVLALRHQ